MSLSLNSFSVTSSGPTKITNGIFWVSANSNCFDGEPKVVMQGILFERSFLASFIVSISSSIEIRRTFTGVIGFICARLVTLSSPKEIPTAGIVLFRYFPTRLSYLPPAAIEPFCSVETISKMFPV